MAIAKRSRAAGVRASRDAFASTRIRSARRTKATRPLQRKSPPPNGSSQRSAQLKLPVRDPEVGGLIRETYAEVLASDKEVSVAEFVSALETLRDRVQRRRITELAGKAERSADDLAELARLQALVSQRAKGLTENLVSRV